MAVPVSGDCHIHDSKLEPSRLLAPFIVSENWYSISLSCDPSWDVCMIQYENNIPLLFILYVLFGNLDSICWRIQKTQWAHLPVEPHPLADLQIPTSNKVTWIGNDFFIHDTGEGSRNRITMFASEIQLRTLAIAKLGSWMEHFQWLLLFFLRCLSFRFHWDKVLSQQCLLFCQNRRFGTPTRPSI